MRSLIRWTVFLSLAPAVFLILVAAAVTLAMLFVVRGVSSYAKGLVPPPGPGRGP